jgi:hypothetical protein
VRRSGDRGEVDPSVRRRPTGSVFRSRPATDHRCLPRRAGVRYSAIGTSSSSSRPRWRWRSSANGAKRLCVPRRVSCARCSPRCRTSSWCWTRRAGTGKLLPPIRSALSLG